MEDTPCNSASSSSTAGSSNRGSSSTATPTDQPPVWTHFLDDIARYANLTELKPIFVEEGLLEDEDLAVDLDPAFSEYSRQCERLDYLKRNFVDQRKRDAFQRCIQKSVDSHGHLGHDYILALFNGTKSEFADEASIKASELLRERIQGKMQKMVTSIKPSLLFHLMVEKRLLTVREFEEKFSKSDCSDSITNERIFALLKTKGPTAHLLFMHCLSESQKVTDEVSCHGELCELLDFNQDCYDSVSPEHPLSPCQIPKYLKGKIYHERRRRFETYYHNGDWHALYIESKMCTDSNIPEIEVIGYLELALGCIFQLNEAEVKKNLRLAHRVITTRIRDPSVLYARHEYYHALLLRYLEQYEEASKMAEVAIMILSQFEVGEDKAFAQYCYATSFVETLTPDCTAEDFQKASKLLITAIDYAEKATDMEILVIYSQLQLIRLYLGTTHTYLTVTRDQSRIERSNKCLQELEKKLERNELNTRFQSLYYLRKSDYHRSNGDINLAEQTAVKAEELATKAGLPIEKKAAKSRIKYIQRLQTPTGTQTVGQKHTTSMDSSSDKPPPTKKKRSCNP